jgi:hypothetical protein
MQDGLVIQYMVETERDAMLGNPALYRRAQHDRELALTLAALPGRRFPAFGLAALIERVRGVFRPAGPRVGAPQA